MRDVLLIACGVLLVLLLGVLTGVGMDTGPRQVRRRAVAAERRARREHTVQLLAEHRTQVPEERHSGPPEDCPACRRTASV